MSCLSAVKTLLNACWNYLRKYWLDYAILVVIIVCVQVLRASDAGKQQLFTAETLAEHTFPEKDSTVPGWTTGIVPWVIPWAVFLTAAALKRLRGGETHDLCLNVLYAVMVTGLLTNVCKLQVGRPRPSFLSRCLPNMRLSGSLLDTTSVLQQVDGRIQGVPHSPAFSLHCSQADEAEVRDAFKSFLSGHTSYYAAGGIYLTLFVFHKLRVFNGSRHPSAVALALLPAAFAGWVGLTRVSDYAHHPTDVVSGYILGAIIGAVFYYQVLTFSHHRQRQLHGTSRVSRGRDGCAGSVHAAMPDSQPQPQALQEVEIAQL